MAHVGRKTTARLSKFGPPPLDAAVVELALSQHGVMSLGQFIELGLSASGVRHRVRIGRLYRVHAGVYALSPKFTAHGKRMAAVLACGPGAVLSHRDAADLWGLRRSSRVAVDVTVSGRSGRRQAGIDVHRPRNLSAADATEHEGIPCTTVAWTLLDLAEVVNGRQLQSACRRAEILRLFDLGAVEDVLERGRGRRGVDPLEVALSRLAPSTMLTRNELERLFVALGMRAGLPRPSVNTWIELPGGGAEIDFAWPDRRLAIETDGYETHGTRSAFEDDRRRDQLLAMAGWRVIRFTWRQIVDDSGEVEKVLRALLAGYPGQFASASR
jgi:restriction endonuclease-like protein/putative AbiEi antitoxin of type IV toxin-antitoxin system